MCACERVMLVRRLLQQPRLMQQQQLRWLGRPRGKPPSAMASLIEKKKERSEWWAVDGEMHEIGEKVPPRERFVIPRDNIPNRRRKQLRDQFMRRTRLVLKDSENEPWCKRYMELYEELRENWERLYWDEGYSKKIAQDHATYESAEDDDADFSPYRRRGAYPNQMKDESFDGNRRNENWEKVGQIRDKFEYDREKRMREKAFAPMTGTDFGSRDTGYRNQPFDRRFVSHSGRD
ncbi:hypothetical protein QJS10_CPB04g01398 [Acorus calamus]|uniref:Uncharacterized protein n=1 Tax=Acorus calamus TaxID=4465 RepID=A0AAV9EZQ0_ACOCL|nr:hypothetical protein QJS10_CPB04g01398 [Acorus calamus]